MTPVGGREPVVNALSFDVEEYFHASALARAFGDSKWSELTPRLTANMERLLDVLDEHRVKATMFILGWVAQHHPRVVRACAERGHEIACHGLSHALVYEQDRATFAGETRDAKHLLEDLAGCSVRGYRAASFSITRKSLWALDVLAEAGFEYDSSIFPVVHDRYGIPGAPRMPYRVELAQGAFLTEFPPSTIRLAGMTLPAGGGGYFRLFPYGFTRFAMRRLNAREGKPMMFYSHPWEIDEEQPRGRVSALTAVRHYRNLGKVLPRLRQMLRSYRFSTVQSVLDDMGAGLPTHRFGRG